MPTKRLRVNLSNMPKKTHIVIFGTGSTADIFFNNVNHDAVHIVCFCDNNKTQQNLLFHDIRVVAPAALVNLQFDFIVIASQFFREIVNDISKMGIPISKVIPSDCTLFQKKVVHQYQETLNLLTRKRSINSTPSIHSLKNICDKLGNKSDQQIYDELVNFVLPDIEIKTQGVLSYLRTHKPRIIEDLSILKRYTRNASTILDVGAIPPIFCAILKQKGYATVSALDIAPERYAKCISLLELNIRKCDIETEVFPFENNTIEYINMCEVFEHLRINLIHTFSECHRILRPKGYIHISTPNARSVRGITALLFSHLTAAVGPDIYTEYSKIQHAGHMGHVREYTAREISVFMNRIGFEFIDIISRGVPRSPTEKWTIRAFPSLSPYQSLIFQKR